MGKNSGSPECLHLFAIWAWTCNYLRDLSKGNLTGTDNSTWSHGMEVFAKRLERWNDIWATGFVPVGVVSKPDDVPLPLLSFCTILSLYKYLWSIIAAGGSVILIKNIILLSCPWNSFRFLTWAETAHNVLSLKNVFVMQTARYPSPDQSWPTRQLSGTTYT